MIADVEKAATVSLSDRMTEVIGVIRAWSHVMADRSLIDDQRGLDQVEERHLLPIHFLVTDLAKEADAISRELFRRAIAMEESS